MTRSAPAATPAMELDDTERPPEGALPLFTAAAAPAPALSAPRARPLRRLILDAGAAALDDEDLIALLLAGVEPPATARQLAASLVSTFRSAPRVLAASPDRLRQVAGIGNAHAVIVKAAEALATRHARAAVPETIDPLLNNDDLVVRYCRTLAAHRPVEELHLLHLDTKNRLIRDECHQRGSINHTPLYPREVCVRALQVNAAALIVVHNHPSNSPTPSRADISMTEKLRDALKLIEVTLHDHLIVTASDVSSFRQLGLL